MNRTYSELSSLPTFQERLLYLSLKAYVGQETFGSDRWLNQLFYRSSEWRKLRREIVIRDNGCEMGLTGYEIAGDIVIHHLNPATLEQIRSNDPILLDPENLVCVSKRLHNAIHYGDERYFPTEYQPRRPNDTCPWKEANDGQYSGLSKENARL